MSDNFLIKAQKRLPHMLHSEIIDHRRWARGQYGSNSKKRRTSAAEEKAKEKEERESMNDKSGTDDEEKVTKKFGVLTAKARKNYKKDCMRYNRSKIRLVKKQAKESWTAVVSASGTMPRIQHQGDECTFDFECTNHPWAKIHATHQAWFYGPRGVLQSVRIGKL